MAKAKRGRRRFFRGAKRRGGRRKFTLPLAIVAGFAPAVVDIAANKDALGWGGSALHTTAGLIGWDTVGASYVGWNQMRAAGTPAILAGFFAHWLAGKLGINRALGRAGIPLIRI